MPSSAAIFNGAQNVVVKDGLFVVADNFTTLGPEGSLDRLLDEVAPNAILNAGGRPDEVRCYPGTREEVIDKIEKWINGEGPRQSRMMWLTGPAGAGKSAIFQTVAERCQDHQTLAANFFFFRGDKTRNRARPIVSTLVYQLLSFYPALNKPLIDCVTAKPLICKAAVGEQFTRLISSPIQTIRHSLSIHRPIVLIIDGLDECEDKNEQEQVLVALHNLVDQDDSPFIVLVASRAEHQVVMSFKKLRTSAESICLDGKYRPQDDIRLFVRAKFDEIKRVHSLAHSLDKHWPTNADIDAITDKSSGQFLYAATVMRFIQHSTVNPALSMLSVHGIQPSAEHSPLTPLDTVYSYIFSQAMAIQAINIQAIKLILGAHIIFESKHPSIPSGMRISFKDLLPLMRYKLIEIESFFADLAAIVKVDAGPPMQLVVYHASLSDYLMDESRSGIYFVDVENIATELTLVCLQQLDDFISWKTSIGILVHVKVATPALSQSLLQASKQILNQHGSRLDILMSNIWKFLMIKLYELYFVTDMALYKRMLRRWIRFAYINNIDIVSEITGYLDCNATSSRRINRYYGWYRLIESLKFKAALKLRLYM